MALDLFVKLSRASASVERRVLRSLDKGLSATQFGILDALYHVGPLCLGELARKHLKSPNNITSVVDTMEHSGLVVRERQSADRRMVRLHLTDLGRRLFLDYWPEHLKQIVDTMSALSFEEQATLAQLLKKLGKGQPG